MFDELLGIAARTGLEVRTRAFRGKVAGKVPFAGGLCTVLGRQLVLLNANGVVEPDSAPRPGLAKTAAPHKKKPQHR